MGKNALLILSGSILNRGIADKFRSKNMNIIVIDRNDKPALSCDYHIQSDVMDFGNISNKLDSLGIKNIAGSYTSADIAIASVNKLNKKYGLRHIDEDLLDDISSKELMVKKWKSKNLFNRVSNTYYSMEIEEIVKLNRKYKTIIKPNRNSSSRGITILDKNSEVKLLTDAFKLAQENSPDRKVLVEEFIEGTELTVEMLGDNFGNVAIYGISVKYHTNNTINNKIAVKLHYNSKTLSLSRCREIAEFGIECYKAFGLKNSLGHLEVLIKEDFSLTPVEINARSSGFIASTLVDISSGRDYLNDYVNVINGEKVKGGLHKSDFSSMYYFYDFPPYKVSKITANLMEFINPRVKSLYHDRSNLIAEKTFDLITSDNDRYGYEILKGHKDDLTIDEVFRAEGLFLNKLFGFN